MGTRLPLAVFSAIVLGASLLGVSPAWGVPDCEGSTALPYDIDLEIDIPAARVIHDRSVAELGQATIHGPESRILGMVKTGLAFGWSIGFDSEPMGEGFCSWVSNVRLTIRQPSPDIYVAREYARGSCQYRTILAHEQKHVNNAREVINRYKPRLRWVLTSLRIPTGRRPIYVTEPAKARARLRKLMKELAEPLYREMARELSKAQAKLDSPASYRLYFKQCKTW